MRTEPLHRIATEVHDIDWTRSIDDDERQAILDIFNRYPVLVFRDQALSGRQQVEFSRRFGRLEGHVRRAFRNAEMPELHRVSNLDRDGRPTREVLSLGNYHWHTDKSYMAEPSMATLLHALELPPAGGDTCFADTQAAFMALSPAERARLAPLRAVHSWETSRRNSGSPPATAEELRDAPPVTHPLARTHPVTGAKSLYLGNHAGEVVGMEPSAGARLLRRLLEHATQPQFVYRHRWRTGDLVMWDNRRLLHKAEADFDLERHRRVLNRTVVKGTKPV